MNPAGPRVTTDIRYQVLPVLVMVGVLVLLLGATILVVVLG